MRRLRVLAASLLLALELGGATAVAQTAPAAPPPPIPGLGGPFRLHDASGAIRTDADFRGRFMLVVFGYTSCPDVCPTELQSVAEALDALPAEVAAKVAPLFISVDPTYDTPERLGPYVAQFHPAIVGLTGSVEEVGRAVRAYRVHVQVAAKDARQIDHTGFMYLMNPEGGFLTLILPGTPAAQIAARIRQYAG